MPITEEQEKIKKQLKKAISSSNLSKSEIARRVGVTRASVGRWENTGKISKEKLLSLCGVFGLEISFFLKPSLKTLDPLQLKLIQIIQDIPKEKYYRLEEVIRLLEED